MKQANINITKDPNNKNHAGRGNVPLCAPFPSNHAGAPTITINVPTLTPEQWHQLTDEQKCSKCAQIIARKLAPEYERR